MMVYHTQNYWVFGLFPSSRILGTRKHDVSETDPVSETSCFLVPRIPDDGKIQKPSNYESFYCGSAAFEDHGRWGHLPVRSIQLHLYPINSKL
jgi:hypothetical protein